MRRAHPGTSPRADHVALQLRQNWAGNAARWCQKQGLVSLALTVLGIAAFVVAAFLIIAPLGWATIGAGCWFLEHLTREEER